jgi:CHAT domain-containing protein
MLVAPADSLLAGVDRLIVVPDGPLALVPFEALLARDADAAGRVPPGAWLVERCAVSYTPSASVLATRRAGGGDSLVMAVGDPAFGPIAVRVPGGMTAAPLPPLPSTADEVTALRQLAGARRVVALVGAAASRGGVLSRPELERASVVHIATHGDVDEAEPAHSGLWLAPDSTGGAPGRLEVGDIASLKLAAGLVTLSACETGLGRLENGEGVVGLARAFMLAGAQSVLVSLWPVNDRSTAALMRAFYARALAPGGTRAAALAAAKRELLRSPATRSPFYWAPFVLSGQADR